MGDQRDNKQDSSPLEPTGREFSAAVQEALRHLSQHLDDLPTMDPAHTKPQETVAAARAVIRPIDLQGRSFEGILTDLFGELIPRTYNTAGPGYLAYIPGGGLPFSAIADLISGVINRYVGVWLAAPGLVEIETQVVRWLCDLVGFPEKSLGFLTTGGSLANFSAVVAARTDKLGDDFQMGTVYVSEQVHHSVAKACRLAGIRTDNVRRITSNEHFQIDLDHLRSTIAQDIESGHTPFLLVGSAGTTNTGAIDDLEALSALADEHNLWLHIDAAYGGFFMLTERGRAAMKGIECADSVTLDPHKGLFLPYGTGALVVRDRKALHAAHNDTAEYLPPMQDGEERVDFCTISPELSRDFRGLRIWLPLQVHGVQPFIDNLDEKLDLANYAEQELLTMSDIEIVATPQLSIVAFRYNPPHVASEKLDELNQRLLDHINAKKHVYMTGTSLPTGFVIRICVLSFRTHRPRMEQAMSDIRQALTELEGA